MTAGRRVTAITTEWCTPPHIVAAVKRVFGGGIALDPCSNEFSVVEAGVEYSLPDHDGLRESWDYPTIFVNPPYGRDPVRGTRIADWLARSAEAAEAGSEVVCLVPVATNTGHWKRSVWPRAAAICFIAQPRVHFYLRGVQDGQGAPMACAAIYYGAHVRNFADVFRDLGAVVPLKHVELPPAASTLRVEPAGLTRLGATP